MRASARCWRSTDRATRRRCADADLSLLTAPSEAALMLKLAEYPDDAGARRGRAGAARRGLLPARPGGGLPQPTTPPSASWSTTPALARARMALLAATRAGAAQRAGGAGRGRARRRWCVRRRRAGGGGMNATAASAARRLRAWAWSSGLLVGLALALGVALYITKVPVPFINKVPQRTAEQDSAETERNRNWDPNAPLGASGRAPGRRRRRPRAPAQRRAGCRAGIAAGRGPPPAQPRDAGGHPGRRASPPAPAAHPSRRRRPCSHAGRRPVRLLRAGRRLHAQRRRRAAARPAGAASARRPASPSVNRSAAPSTACAWARCETRDAGRRVQAAAAASRASNPRSCASSALERPRPEPAPGRRRPCRSPSISIERNSNEAA